MSKHLENALIFPGMPFARDSSSPYRPLPTRARGSALEPGELPLFSPGNLGDRGQLPSGPKSPMRGTQQTRSGTLEEDNQTNLPHG